MFQFLATVSFFSKMVILGMQFPPQYYQQMRVAQTMPDDVNGMQRQHPAVMMDPRMAQVIKFKNNISCIATVT